MHKNGFIILTNYTKLCTKHKTTATGIDRSSSLQSTHCFFMRRLATAKIPPRLYSCTQMRPLCNHWAMFVLKLFRVCGHKRLCRPATLIWHKIWMKVRKNLKKKKTGKKSESFYQNSTFYKEISTNFKAKKSEFWVRSSEFH